MGKFRNGIRDGGELGLNGKNRVSVLEFFFSLHTMMQIFSLWRRPKEAVYTIKDAYCKVFGVGLG